MTKQVTRSDEDRVRRKAKKLIWSIHKSRAGINHLDNYGRYMLVNDYNNSVIGGARFDLSLEDCESWIDQELEKPE